MVVNPTPSSSYLSLAIENSSLFSLQFAPILEDQLKYFLGCLPGVQASLPPLDVCRTHCLVVHLAISNDCLVIIWSVSLWLHALLCIIVLFPNKIPNDLESRIIQILELEGPLSFSSSTPHFRGIRKPRPRETESL